MKNLQTSSLTEEMTEKRQLKLENARLDNFINLGRYTFIICIFSELLILCQLSNMIYMVFAGAAPSITSCNDYNFDSKLDLKERCKIIKSLNETCKPKISAQFVSFNVEFEYYCSPELVKKTITFQMIGVMFGSVIFGNLSDRFGRKKIMLIALSLCLTCMLGTSFANSLTVFTIWRFFVCVFNGGTMVILLVFMVENLPKKDRFWISNVITWSPNMILYALIAYFAQTWRILTIVSTIITLPCIIILLYLCESPQYLFQSKDIKATREAILRIYRINKVKCDTELLDFVLNIEDKTQIIKKTRKQYNFYHLFYTLTYTRYTIAVAFSLLVTSILNYSLLFNMEKLSGSLYLNIIIMGFFRYCCNLSIAFCDKKFKWMGRKLVHILANTLCAIPLGFCSIAYILGYQKELSSFVRIAVLNVIAVCSLLYTTNGLVSNELFPTCIRNTSYSFGQLFSRIGVTISPLVFLLSDYWKPLPYVFMLALAVTDCFLFQFNVTETKGKSLNDSELTKKSFFNNKKESNCDQLLEKKKESNSQTQ